MFRVHVLLMILATAWPTLVRGQSPTDRAIQLFREANVHFNLGQHALAVDKYTAAIRADPTLAGPYRNLGLAYRAQGKCTMALANFRKYLQLQPHGRHNKRVRQEIAYCAGQIGEDPNANVVVGAAQIIIEVNVSGAQILVDRVPRGSSPLTALPVSPGRHTVAVLLQGYLPWNGTVELQEGQTLKLEVDLERDQNAKEQPFSRPTRTKPGTLRLVALPSRASVTVDGALVVPNEDGEVRLESGRRQVTIAQGGIQPWTRELPIRPGETTSIILNLQPTPQTRTLRRWAWAFTGTAAALGIAGAVVGLVENNSFQSIRDFDRSTGTRQELDALERGRQRQALASNLLLGFAGAGLGVAVVLFAITPEFQPPPSSAR